MKKDNGPIALIGAGGHAEMLVSTLVEAGYAVAGLFDDNPDLVGRRVLGYEVLGSPETALEMGLKQAIMGIGNNAARCQMVRRLAGLDFITLIHPSAYVHSSCRIGTGTVVMIGCIVRPLVTLGRHTIINTGAAVGHDCMVGDFVHIAGSSHLGGGAVIENGAFLGLGTIVNPCKRVGAWSTIGSGGVVVKDIPPNVTAVGVPAQVIKHHIPVEEIHG